MSKKLARFRLDTCPNQYFAYGPDMDGELLDWQIDLLRAFDEKRARFFILEVGRRSRKTTTAINVAIRACIEKPRQTWRFWGPTQKAVRDNIWNEPTMVDLYLPRDEKGRALGWKKNEQTMTVRFANRSILHFNGSDDPEAKRGLNAHGTVIDEWSECNPRIWFALMRPVIADLLSRC